MGHSTSRACHNNDIKGVLFRAHLPRCCSEERRDLALSHPWTHHAEHLFVCGAGDLGGLCNALDLWIALGQQEAVDKAWHVYKL